jgi:hypothetical protein
VWRDAVFVGDARHTDRSITPGSGAHVVIGQSDDVIDRDRPFVPAVVALGCPRLLAVSLCLPALAPIEECHKSPRNARGTVPMSLTGVHPALPGDMHGRVRVWLGVGLTGEALRLLHVHSMYDAGQERSGNRGPGPLESARTTAAADVRATTGNAQCLSGDQTG